MEIGDPKLKHINCEASCAFGAQTLSGPPIVALVLSVVLCSAMLAAETAPEAPVTPETVASETVVKAAKEQIAKLSGDNFDDREAAQHTLEKMDLALLPWLRKQLSDDQAKKELSAESRDALTRVIAELDKRNEFAALGFGTAVSLKLDGATPAEVFAALEKQTLNPPIRNFDTVLAATKKDFTYNGPYWGAIEEVLRVYPPKAGEEIRREKFGFQTDDEEVSRSSELNFFNAYQMAHANAGICCLRVGRVSLEREAAGTFLSIVVVPHMEGRFTLHDGSLKIAHVTLPNGDKLEPAEKDLHFRDPWREAKHWALSIDVSKRTEMPATAEIEGSIELLVYEMKHVRQDVTHPGPYNLLGDVKLNLIGDVKELKLSIAGTGMTPPRRYSNDFLSCVKLLGTDGKAINYTNSGSSSRSSMTDWQEEWPLHPGEMPTVIELDVAVAKPKFTVPFVIKDVPLPGGKK